MKFRNSMLALLLLAPAGSVSCGDNNSPGTPVDAAPPVTDPDAAAAIDAGVAPVEWPDLVSEIPRDEEIENAVTDLLAQMSLAQKVGQMVQPEIQSIDPDQVKEFHIGSVLNGGGSWPGANKDSTVADWVTLADAYYDASMETDPDDASAFLAIPIIWGSDAVHGHSNVIGATLFPHNIGLGAARDPDLIQRIAEITAAEVSVTGLDWTFAPTVAVVRDDRWGRTYEGFSEDPEIVRDYAGKIVRGVQGDPQGDNLFGEGHIISTAKHFLGDGGTTNGKDQGNTEVSEQELLDIHAQGYVSAIPAGTQSVMVSFSSWNGDKMHGSKYLITDVLKGTMNFDGFVISDWNGHGQVPGCSDNDCPAAINAGIDMIMVPYDWEAFISNTIAAVEAGDIPMERIDDAVRRILRVKMRFGLLGPKADAANKGKPSTRPLAGNTDILGSDEHRAVAREAVRKSLVLLKNDGDVLPLADTANVLVAGKTADHIGNQSGGWTITWQGTGNENADFPGATSIFAGLEAALSASGGSATLRTVGAAPAPAGTYDAIIAVIGETPYAEGQGDISPLETLEHAKLNPEDLELLEALRTENPDVPIITVFVSGRPLWVNKELNLSDAFVAAWLPGSEGGGVADVLTGEYDFHGKLSYSWPVSDCQTQINRGGPNVDDALFAYGYGLTYEDSVELGDELSEETSEQGCDAPPPGGGGTTDQVLNLFTSGANRGNFVLRMGGPSNWGGVPVEPGSTLDELAFTRVDGEVQESAVQFTWNGTAQVYSQTSDSAGVDLRAYANSNSTLFFRIRRDTAIDSATVMNLSTHCVYPCLGEVPLLATVQAMPLGEWQEVRVPVSCLVADGLDPMIVNTPFLLYADGDFGTTPITLSIEDMRWEPNTADQAPACGSFQAAGASQ